MKKFILCLLSIFTISMTAVSLSNFDENIKISNLHKKQTIENQQTHVFEIRNNSSVNKLVRFELNNQK